MVKRSGKRKQRYVYHPRDLSKLTCLIHGPLHSSDEFKVFNYFVTTYTKDRPFEGLRQDTTFKKKIGKKQDVNNIVQHSVDDIILQEREK